MNKLELTERVDNNIEENLASALGTFLDEREAQTKPPDNSTQQGSQSQHTTQLSSWAAAHGYDQGDLILTSIRHSLELRRARTATIDSLPDMSLEQKIRLRDILGYDNWPTHFQTHENLHAPRPNSADPSNDVWSRADECALELIMNYSPAEIGVIASTFFPERFVNDVYLEAEEILNRNNRQDQTHETYQETSSPMTWARLGENLGVVAAVERS